MILTQLQTDFSKYTFAPSDHFQWSPHENIIYFVESDSDERQGLWSLLHEIGHAELTHESFINDLDLVKKERAAWSKALEISKAYEIDIDPEYVEDCLDSYRDWLKARATCPECSTVTNQTSSTTYHCFNCGCEWKVSPSQTCSIRRSRIKAK